VWYTTVVEVGGCAGREQPLVHRMPCRSTYMSELSFLRPFCKEQPVQVVDLHGQQVSGLLKEMGNL
jgi:hypothetical protein